MFLILFITIEKTMIFCADAEAQTPILWPPDVKNWLIGKDPDAGKDWRWKEKDGWMASLTQCTWVWVSSGSWWWTGKPGVLRFMGSQCQTRLSNWTELNWAAQGLGKSYFKEIIILAQQHWIKRSLLWLKEWGRVEWDNQLLGLSFVSSCHLVGRTK